MLAHLHYAKIGLALHQNEHIYPYVSAGNGRKLFSYMQAGIAIIAPKFGEIGKSVADAKCGVLINSEDVKEVANTIIQLLSDPQEMREVGFLKPPCNRRHFDDPRSRPDNDSYLRTTHLN